MTDQHAGLLPLSRWPTLAGRDSGSLPPPPEFYEGVPAHLDRPLLHWVEDVLTAEPELAQRVLSRLRVSYDFPDSPRSAVLGLVSGRAAACRDPFSPQETVDPMSVVNAILGLHSCWNLTHNGSTSEKERQYWDTKLTELMTLLADSGSAWQVNTELRGLYRVVDPPIVEGWQRAREAAENSGRPGAARFLDEAWKYAYGTAPQPTSAYDAAVKAVEAVAVPLVLPTIPKATVHRVRTHLRNHGDRWRFVLAEADGVAPGEGSIDIVTTMLDRLLQGETGRHGVEDANRPSTQPEAQAAVHLAAVLMQWFVSGAIRQRETS